MLDRKLAAGELAPPPSGDPEELPLVAAAIAHLERAERAAATGRGGGAAPAQRRAWRRAGRVEALRGNR